MAGGSQKQYSAVFSIGAKLLGSFRGVMAQAQARMHKLRETTMRFGEGIFKVFERFGAGLSLFAGFAAGKVFSSIFEGASEAAIEADQQARQLSILLLQHNEIRKRGLPFARKQTELIFGANEALAQQGVIGGEVLNSASASLSVYGYSPKKIAAMMGPLADVLVTMKGVSATQENAVGLARAWGVAVKTGMTKGLKQFGFVLSDTQQKEFKGLKNAEARNKWILKWAQGLKGANAEASKTDAGKIAILHNQIKSMSKDIGNELLPVQAEMADAWSKALPETKPAIIGTLKALGHSARWAGKQVADLFARLTPPQEEQPGLQLFTQYQDMLGTFNAVKGQKDQSPSFDATSDVMNQWTRSGSSQLISALGKVGEALDGLGPHFETNKQQATSWGDWLGGVVDDLQIKMAETLKSDAEDIVRLGKAWEAFKKDASISILVDDWNNLLKVLKSVWDWMKVNLTNEKLLSDAQKLFGGIRDALLNNLLGPIQNIKKEWGNIMKAWDERPKVFGGVPPPKSALPPPQAGPPISISMPASAAAAAKISAPAKTALQSNARPPQAAPPIPMAQASASRVLPAAAAVAKTFPQPPPVVAAANIPNIPGAATGGIIRGHSLLQVAERGPEAIIPLAGGPRAEGLLHYAARAMGLGGITNNNNREQNITFAPQITIHGGDGDSGQERKIEAQLRKLLYAEFIPALNAATKQARRVSYESGYS